MHKQIIVILFLATIGIFGWLRLWHPRKKSDGEFTPLHIAAQMDDAEYACKLLDQDADKEAQTSEGFTPLHKAAQDGAIKVAKLLLERGADTEAKLKGNEATPLHLAAQWGHSEIVNLLLKHNANIEAIKGQHIGVGYTPLHVAAKNGHTAIIKILLDNGAQKEAKTIAGLTAMQIAKQEGKSDAVRLLQEYGK